MSRFGDRHTILVSFCKSRNVPKSVNGGYIERTFLINIFIRVVNSSLRFTVFNFYITVSLLLFHISVILYLKMLFINDCTNTLNDPYKSLLKKIFFISIFYIC